MNKSFVGRKEELRQLSTNFVFQTNTILLAPHGWGKTSLVMKAAADAASKEKKFRLCHVCISNIRDEERFYELLSESVLKAVSSSIEDAVRKAEFLFGRLSPQMSFPSASVEGLKLSFDWNKLRNCREDLTDIPFKAAREYGLRLTVCIDDFQAVGNFPAAEQFVSMIAERWQRHEGVSYCVCSSEVAVSEKLAKSKVFGVYGQVIRLGKIDRVALANCLKDEFAESGKYLDMENALRIISMAEGHPYYIKRLASAALTATSVVCSPDVIQKAHDEIIRHMHIIFSTVTSSLTSQQLCYIHAVLAGETVISTSEVLHRHHISSATSASRSKAALLEKEIICINSGRAVMTDPLYAHWLRNIYFKNK